MNQPVQLAGRRRAATLDAVQQGLTTPQPPRVSIKAQRFTLIDSMGVQIPVQLFDPQYGPYLDAVIVGANPNKSKIYYENMYDPNNDEPPTCFSDNGLAPSTQASVPQSPTCGTCPNNVWGSDVSRVTGKGTKACSDRKKLALLVVNDPAQLVYSLTVPPATLKNLGAYANALKSHQVTDSEGQRSADPADVVTRIFFDPQQQGILMFQPLGFHQQLYPYIDGLIAQVDQTGAIEAATNAGDKPYQGAIALPNPQVAPMAQLPAPQQMVQPPPPPQQAMPQYQPPAGGFPPNPVQPGPNMTPQQQAAFGTPPQGMVAGGGFAAQQAPQQAAPAPRGRRGGARAGAGRPGPQAAPQQAPAPQQGGFQPQPMAAPQPAPFAQPAAAPGSAPFSAPYPMQPAPMNAPPGGVISQPQPALNQPPPGAIPGPQPAPFHPHMAQPVQQPLQGNDPGPAPAFLQVPQPGAPQPQQFQQPAPQAPQQGGPAFGMQNGAQPHPQLAAELQNAFGAPMAPRQR